VLENYVLLDKAELVNKHLTKLVNENKFNEISDKKEFVKAVQKEMQIILNDKHFRVLPPRTAITEQSAGIWQDHLESLTNFRKGGFQDIRIFDGNVGYVKVDGFRREDTHQVDALMSYLATVDAIIFDVRENGGGAEPVNYLSSYFLPDNTLIGKTYHRKKDSWREHISESVEGKKRFDVPVFILTSDFTFSAAESFTYNLQAQKRATIVGEISGGGAHPIQFFPLPEGLAMIVPNKRSYNPITKTNWEGTGVIPDVVTTEEQALATVKKLAQQAAKKFREELFSKITVLIAKNKSDVKTQAEVNSIVSKLIHRKHIEPFMVAAFAREYVRQGNENAAKLLFRANIHLSPKTAEPYFQYARALTKLKQHEQAKNNFEQSIKIAKNNKSDKLVRYQAEMKKLLNL